jgi:TP901 family phage tail tape measure protein
LNDPKPAAPVAGFIFLKVMANRPMKLELLLKGKDQLSAILKRPSPLIKQLGKDALKTHNSLKKLFSLSPKNNFTGFGKQASAEFRQINSEIAKLKRNINSLSKIKAPKINVPSVRQPSSRGIGNRRFGGNGEWVDDAALTGTGAGGFWLAQKGMSGAMTKQSAMSELYTSFYRSSVSAAELNKQMAEGERLADILGTKLPGTSADMISLFAVMKKRGIEANVILNGAGEAAANLAVANKEDLQETGINVARFGQMFDLKKREEYIGAADLMSRAYTTYGIQSGELMEAVKDFSGRTGKGLGLEGNRGAEDTLRYLAFLRAKTGMQGLTVGNAASSFFNQYLQAKEKKKDPTDELKKLTGVDLQIFDKQGKFLGLENAVKEFSKLKGKLSDEKMVSFGNALAGEEGASIFQAMVKNGDQWNAFNSEMSTSMGLMDKSAKNAQNLTNKVEALLGSLENLGAAGFKPLVKPLSDLADGTNDLAGTLTNLAATNPGIARTVVTIGLLGSAVLAFKGGAGILSRFGGEATNSFTTAWKSADTFKGKLSALKNIAASPITVSLQIMAAGMTIDHLLKVFEEIRERNQKLEENNKSIREQYDRLMGEGKLYNYTKETGQSRPELDAFANTLLETMKQGRALEFALQPERAGTFEHFWTSQRPYTLPMSAKPLDRFMTPFSKEKALEMWKDSDISAGFRDPNVLARLVAKIESGGGMNLGNEGIKLLLGAIEEKAGTEKMQQARQILAEDNRRMQANPQQPGVNPFNFNPLNFNQRPFSATPTSQFQAPAAGLGQFQNVSQLFNPLQQSITPLAGTISNLDGRIVPLGENFSGLGEKSNVAVTGINNLATQVSNAAVRLSNVQFTAPTIETIRVPIQFDPNSSGNTPPGKARGGSVTRGNWYRINEVGQEFFMPSASGSVVSNDMLRSRKGERAAAPVIHLSVPITLYSDNPNDAKKAVDAAKQEIAGLMSYIREEMHPDRIARKVAHSADRDSERT